jgi:hypothetical protein
MTPAGNPRKCRSVFDIIGALLAVLWKDWPKGMKHKWSVQNGAVKHLLSGKCPQCREISNFYAVTEFYREPVEVEEDVTRLCAVFRCPGCDAMILGILREARFGNSTEIEYEIHYPTASPNEVIDDDIPKDVAADFIEALRCFSAKAPRATIIMCRRALEVSCSHLGAKRKSLDDKIKELAAAGKLNPDLEEMAHTVRLGARAAAHLKEGDLENVGDVDAEAMIEFTQAFLEQVHVATARRKRFMKKFDNRKASRSDKTGP